MSFICLTLLLMMYFTTIFSLALPVVASIPPALGEGCYNQGQTWDGIGHLDTINSALNNICIELTGTYTNRFVNESQLPTYHCHDVDSKNSIKSHMLYSNADADIPTVNLDRFQCAGMMLTVHDMCEMGGEFMVGMGWYVRLDPQHGTCSRRLPLIELDLATFRQAFVATIILVGVLICVVVFAVGLGTLDAWYERRNRLLVDERASLSEQTRMLFEKWEEEEEEDDDNDE